MKALKKYLLDVLAIVFFAIISFVYFMPADMDGRILYQHDASAGRGAGQEAAEYYQKTGHRTRSVVCQPTRPRLLTPVRTHCL